MSGSGTNHWKLGAFVSGTVALGVGALFWLGANRFDVETIERVSYFSESVQGLDVGAPVKVRGVPIGQVADIRIAPDGKLVEVRARIRVEDLRRLGFVSPYGPAPESSEDDPFDLRVKLATTGITGVKFIEADFVSPDTPTPELSFTPPANFLASAPSTLASLEEAARGIGNELPETLAEFRRLATTLEARVAAVDTSSLDARVERVLDEAFELFRTANEVVAGLSGEGAGGRLDGVVEEASLLFRDAREVVRSLEDAIERIGGEDGPVDRAATSLVSISEDAGTLVDAARETLRGADVSGTLSAVTETTSSVQGAAGSLEALARDISPVAGDLRAMLLDLRAALRRVEDLAAYLERDPGSLLRGRSGR